jgi:hypothetical protein
VKEEEEEKEKKKEKNLTLIKVCTEYQGSPEEAVMTEEETDGLPTEGLDP